VFVENAELVTVKVPPDSTYTAPPPPALSLLMTLFPENVGLVMVEVPPDAT
jgi:hypothetical protein